MIYIGKLVDFMAANSIFYEYLLFLKIKLFYLLQSVAANDDFLSVGAQV